MNWELPDVQTGFRKIREIKVEIANICWIMGSPCSSVVKNSPAKQEMQVQSLGQEDPLVKETATYSSILAWEIPRTEEPGRLQSMGCEELDMA